MRKTEKKGCGYKVFLLIFISLMLLPLKTLCAQAKRYDIIITNARIIDGSGNPPYKADLAIKKDKIAKIGMLKNAKAKKIIDASNLIIAPGFIDIHTHADVDGDILKRPQMKNYIHQGVTTVVTGNCGGSPIDIAGYYRDIRKNGTAVNVATLIGHGDVRKEVMGMQNRPATREDVNQMKEIVARAMQDGAIGISTGLVYVPAAYSDTNEIVALAEVVSRHGGFYATHMRDEGDALIEAAEEAIEIGKRAKLPVQISHLKAMGKRNWGKTKKVIKLIEQAVDQGMDITMDQYPYAASCTGLSVMFPSWALAGGQEKLFERLNDPEQKAKIWESVFQNVLLNRGGGDPSMIVIAECKHDPSLDGKSIADIIKERGMEVTIGHATDVIIEIQSKAEETILTIYHSMDEEEIETVMAHPLVMHITDGAAVEFEKGKPHPRSYGSFPRVLAEYVREKHVITLPDAIRKMTSLPAQRIYAYDRGVVREGMIADLAIFHPEEVKDTATWSQPHRYAAGIPYVIVNGQMTIEKGEYTGTLSGKILYGPANN